jgi:hypothetical protein
MITVYGDYMDKWIDCYQFRPPSIAIRQYLQTFLINNILFF